MTEENDLMSEFRKLQSETTGIRSSFADKSSFVMVDMSGNKMAKDIHDFCEKTTELHDRFNKNTMKKLDVVEAQLKDQRETAISQNDLSKKEILKQMQVSETKQKEEISQIRNEMNEMKESVLLIMEESKKEMLKEMRTIIFEQKIENKKQEKPVVVSDENKKTECKEKELSEKPIYRKEFEMKQTFKDILEISKGKTIYGEPEEHFRIEWTSECYLDGEHMCFLIVPVESKNNEKWEMEAEMKIKTIGSTEMNTSVRIEKAQIIQDTYWMFEIRYGWNDIRNNYLINGDLTITMDIRIDKVNGFYEPIRRNFDESMKEFSDVVLNVGGKKFFLYKILKLASLSPYFKKLHDGLLMNSEGRQFSLSGGIGPDDFQLFLEVLYDEPIDERTVEICLLLARRFEAETIIKRCEEFLIEQSQKTVKDKLQLAIKYKLDLLKARCATELVSGYINDIDSSPTDKFLNKLLSLE